MPYNSDFVKDFTITSDRLNFEVYRFTDRRNVITVHTSYRDANGVSKQKYIFHVDIDTLKGVMGWQDFYTYYSDAYYIDYKGVAYLTFNIDRTQAVNGANGHSAPYIFGKSIDYDRRTSAFNSWAFHVHVLSYPNSATGQVVHEHADIYMSLLSDLFVQWSEDSAKKAFVKFCCIF